MRTKFAPTAKIGVLGMAQIKVEAYSLGFGLADNQAFLHYWLHGDETAHALKVSPTQMVALADIFRHERSVVYDGDRQSFVSSKERVGNQDDQPHPKYP